jgi:hypothetical protein
MSSENELTAGILDEIDRASASLHDWTHLDLFNKLEQTFFVVRQVPQLLRYCAGLKVTADSALAWSRRHEQERDQARVELRAAHVRIRELEKTLAERPVRPP